LHDVSPEFFGLEKNETKEHIMSFLNGQIWKTSDVNSNKKTASEKAIFSPPAECGEIGIHPRSVVVWVV